MDDLEEYEIVIIALVAVIVLAVIVILVKRCRRRSQAKDELRTVSTIQTAYFTPTQSAQYPTNQNYANSSAPGWHLTDLDRPSTGVNIQQPPPGAFIVPREPVVFQQYGYPPYPRQEPNNLPYPRQEPSNLPYPPQEPHMMHGQVYEKPPPYNPGL